MNRNEAVLDPQSALAESLEVRFKALSRYKNLLDERGNAMLGVAEKSGPASRPYLSLAAKLAAAEDQLQLIAAAVRRPVSRWGVRTQILIVVAFGLALLEAPANKFLFDVALQSSGIVSYAVSAGVTAFLLFLAHFAGRSARQVWSDYRSKVIWSNVAVFILCTLAAFTIIAVLTVARAAFATMGGSIGDLVSGIQGHIENLGPLGALVAALSDTSALVLACINFGGIITAFVLAFFSHDSDRDYDRSHHNVERLEKDMERTHAEYLKERARIVARYAPDLVGAATLYNGTNAKVIAAKTRLGISLDDADSLIVTDLDQMAEVFEKQEAELGHSRHPGARPKSEPGFGADVVDIRPTGTDGR